MSHWLQMGGYARFLWPSYGITFLVVALNIWWARRSAREARALARRRIANAASRSTT
ncbi:MAG TPA: heme exporter protein CcmD [Steroidobacteraceae bacterium]|nr:heme exporter protein CcmD [Steroidobacteraceae bacterium]